MNYIPLHVSLFVLMFPLFAAGQASLSMSSGLSIPIPGYDDPDLANIESMGAKRGIFTAINVDVQIREKLYVHFMGALSSNEYEIYNTFYRARGRYSPVYLMLGAGYKKQWNRWSLRLMLDIGAVGIEDIHQKFYANRIQGSYEGEVLEERQFQNTWGIVYGAQINLRYAIAKNWLIGVHVGVLDASKMDSRGEWFRYEDNYPFPGALAGVITKEFEPSIFFLALELAYEF